MTHIPTVRVANPADSTAYMTINASDYRPLVHGDLWHEQAPGFEGLPPPPPATYNEAERRFAADLMIETVAFRELVLNDRELHALSPAERMTVLRDARHEFERSRDEFVQNRKRQMQVSDREAAQQAASVVPGQTPGHPVDSVTGKPLHLTDEQRSVLAEVKLGPQAQPGGNELVQGQAGAAPAPANPAPPAPAPASSDKPAWAAKPAPEPPAQPATTVEKGVGGKYYVMRAGKPLSPGFAKKAEAEAELPKYTG